MRDRRAAAALAAACAVAAAAASWAVTRAPAAEAFVTVPEACHALARRMIPARAREVPRRVSADDARFAASELRRVAGAEACVEALTRLVRRR